LCFCYFNCYYGSSDSNNNDSSSCFSFFILIKLLDVDPQDQGEEDGAVVDLDSQRKGKCAVIKTSTRQVRNTKQYLNRCSSVL
jgi:hypothetical protein